MLKSDSNSCRAFIHTDAPVFLSVDTIFATEVLLDGTAALWHNWKPPALVWLVASIKAGFLGSTVLCVL